MEQNDPPSESGNATDEDKGEATEHSSPTSQEDKEEARVPLYRLNQVLDQTRSQATEIAELKAKVEQATAPKTYSRTELNNAVEREEITQDKADEILDTQLKSEVKAEITQEVRDDANQERLTGIMTEFEAAVPELADETSSIHNRVVQQLNRLLGYGSPNNAATQLAAIEAVLGPLQALKNRPSAQPDNPAIPESGGVSQQDGSAPIETKWGDLSKSQKDHYENAIRQGAYLDQNAVLEELNWKRPT